MRIQSPKPPHRREADTFENWVSPEIAAHYRRLCTDKRVAEVIRTLKRRGMTDWGIEILFRNIASIRRDWRSDNESWKQAVRRRNRLAKKLRALAEEIVSDPDLGGLGFRIRDVVYGHSYEDLDDAQSLAQILEMGISILEPKDKPLIRTAGGETLTPSEFERRFRPEKRIPRKSYVLLAIFKLLNPSFAAESNSQTERRALNRETEILTSVLLKEQITPGTVTQLRKKTRRRYAREK